MTQPPADRQPFPNYLITKKKTRKKNSSIASSFANFDRLKNSYCLLHTSYLTTFIWEHKITHAVNVPSYTLLHFYISEEVITQQEVAYPLEKQEFTPKNKTEKKIKLVSWNMTQTKKRKFCSQPTTVVSAIPVFFFFAHYLFFLLGFLSRSSRYNSLHIVVANVINFVASSKSLLSFGQLEEQDYISKNIANLMTNKEPRDFHHNAQVAVCCLRDGSYLAQSTTYQCR